MAYFAVHSLPSSKQCWCLPKLTFFLQVSCSPHVPSFVSVLLSQVLCFVSASLTPFLLSLMCLICLVTVLVHCFVSTSRRSYVLRCLRVSRCSCSLCALLCPGRFVVRSFVHSFCLSTALQRATLTSSHQLRYEQAKHVDGLQSDSWILLKCFQFNSIQFRFYRQNQ